MPHRVKVLVVDDSAYLRKTLSEMLGRHPMISVVGTAYNGRDALDRVAELEPDVVTLDLNMPEMNGVEFLREQMARKPIAAVVVSIVNEDESLAGEAIQAGAAEFVQKPTHLASEEIRQIERELQAKVLAASRIPSGRLLDPEGRVRRGVSVRELAVDAVVLGLSTGGPRALRYLARSLPGDIPVPLAAVVHMPIGYTLPFAQALDDISELEVREAEDGMEMRPGRLILGQAGMHLGFEAVGDTVLCRLSVDPLAHPHRPSVDELFRSAAEVYGHRVLGVVLTGMGDDGTRGAAWIKAQGGQVLAEAEETCVVYGMPRSVVEAGLADVVAPLHRLPEAILERL